MWRQVVNVSPETLYEVSAWVETEKVNFPGTANLEVLFRDSGGRFLERVRMPKHAGTIKPWLKDFPIQAIVKSPKNSATAEFNLFFKGPGKARFDDVYFGKADSGTISGFVSDGAGPIKGAEVELYGTGRKTSTDANGYFDFPLVPVASPRWILIAGKQGYKDAVIGGIGLAKGRTTWVALTLRPGSNPHRTSIRIKAGRLYHCKSSNALTVDPNAVIDKSKYPREVLPFLKSNPYIDSDSKAVKTVARNILNSVPPSQRKNLKAVSHAMYMWVVRNIEFDTIYNPKNYIDPTCGAWQTISGIGWSWGHNFTDWLYIPSEALAQKRAICIEHARLASALLRALGIPARPMYPNKCMFWVQPGSGNGYWVSMATNGGRVAYRTKGDEYAAYGKIVPSEVRGFAIDEGPIVHSDWYTRNECLWREKHPWEERYPDSASGKARALSDLRAFGTTGNAPKGYRIRFGAAHYAITYSDFTLDLRNIGRQRSLRARFPFAVTTGYVTDLGKYAWWCSDKNCVKRVWITEDKNPPVKETKKWLNLQIDLTPILGAPEPVHTDVKVNGKDGTVKVKAGTRVTFTVSLKAGNLLGKVTDWWITMATPFGWVSCKFPGLWTWGTNVLWQGPVFDVNGQVPVLDTKYLPPGTYTMYFCLDKRNGYHEGTYSDWATVVVE